jgi:hypothetical protein
MPEVILAERELRKIKKWSILIYLAGGKDVSDEARESLLRMKQVGSTKNIHVVAQFDAGSEGIFTKRYYLSPFRCATEIDSILTQACAVVPCSSEPYDSTFGMNYYQRLRKALTVNHTNRLDKMSAGEIIKLLKYSPDQFKSFVLDCILDDDIYPRPSGYLGEADAGDPKVLEEFVVWAKTRYPADHYMVIIWGHGAGLSVAWDYPSSPFVHQGDALTIQKMKDVFPKIAAAATNEEKAFRVEETQCKKKPKDLPKEYKYKPGIDIVGFNSCSLGMIEVYQQLSGLVDYGIASEGFTPKTSWPYDKILKDLDDAIVPEKVNMKADVFAAKIVKSYIDYYTPLVQTAQDLKKIDLQAKRLGASLDMNMAWSQGAVKPRPDLAMKPSPDLAMKPSPDLAMKPSPDLGLQGQKVGGGVDLSFCVLKRTNKVTEAMESLVHELLNKLTLDDVGVSIFAAVLGAHAVSQSYFNKDFTDLHDFCRALHSFCSDSEIKKCCESVMGAIKEMCPSPGNFGNDVKNSHGVSIFFPWSDWGKEEVIERYKELDFINRTNWDIFLAAYRKLVDAFEAGSIKSNAVRSGTLDFKDIIKKVAVAAVGECRP